MGSADRIAAALADLESQAIPNYKATAKKHGVVRMYNVDEIVYRENPSQTREATTEHGQALNATPRNDTFRAYSAVGNPRYVQPPTPAIVRNLCGRDCMGSFRKGC